MRVVLDVIDRGGEHFAVVTVPDLPPPGLPPAERPVRWTADRRLLVAKDEPIGDEEARELARRVDAGVATTTDTERYGTLLFEAAFGAETWRRLALTAAGALAAATAGEAPYLELAVRGHPTAPAPEVQALRWEALHDGAAPVAARGTAAGEAGASRLPVAVVRLVPRAESPAVLPAAFPALPVTRIPRVLYAIGSRLTDPRVRPGAEFMGILRHLERKGGAVQPRVLESATADSLAAELERFRPDVLHVIGHGRRFEVEGCVKLQLRPESPSAVAGEEFVTAAGLLRIFGQAGHVPAMVVLSACQTGSGPVIAEGPVLTEGAVNAEGTVNALPFAAGLVAGGVPVAVAMAGDISDTACRVFTRSLTQAIGDGVPVADAVLRGRRAVFHARPDLLAPAEGADAVGGSGGSGVSVDGHSADWLLPVVFLAEGLPGSTLLADTAAIEAARRRCHLLDLAWEPVFCGRGEFVGAMDRLLDPGDNLSVLVACTGDPRKSYGGMRLLRELAARAVRAGRLPVLLGPFDDDPPVTWERLAEEIRDRLDDMRGYLGLPERPDRLAAAAPSGPRELARAMRESFAELVADLPDGDPVRASREPRVVLLCHRVDKWLHVLPELFDSRRGMLGRRGLGVGEHKVPVVLTGADEGDLASARERLSGSGWAKFLPLRRFRADDEDPEDILAYLWWLLNPPEQTPVYAPKRGTDPADWRDLLRHAMRNAAIYDEEELFGWAKAARAFFTSDTDDDILRGYTRAAP